jgi:hypothetical protein
MRIRMRVKGPAWTFYGQEWPEIGGIIDLPEGVARDMVSGGYAEPAGAAPVEAAVVEPRQTAAKRTGRAKGRTRG